MAVGTAFINLIPEIKGFHRQARRDLKREELTAKVKLLPEFDRQDARRQVEESKKAIGRVTITMTPDLDAGAAQAQASSVADRLRRSVPFDVGLDSTGTSSEASATASSLRRSVPFAVNLDAAAARGQASTAAAGMRHTVPFHVDLDTAGARTQATMAAASMRRTVTFNVDIDRNMLGSAVAAVGAGGASMASSGLMVGNSFARAGLLVALLGPLIVAAVGVAAAGIMAIPALLGAVAVPIAAIVLGLEGIKAAAATVAPAFAPIKQAVSDTFRAVLIPVFQQLTALVPILQAGLVGTAQALGVMASAITGVVTSSAGLAWLGQIFAGVNALITGMAPAMATLTAAFMQLAAVGIGPLATGLIAAVTNFAMLFQQMIQQAAATGLLQTSITMFTQVLGILLAILPPLLMAGMQMFMIFGPSMMAAFQALIPVLSPIMQLFGILTAVFFQLLAALLPVIGALFNALLPVLYALMPVVFFVANVLGTVLVAALQFITPMLQVLAPVIAALLVVWAAWSLWNMILSSSLWATTAALFALPITWIIIGIVALVAAVIYAWQNFGWFRDIVTGAWNMITAAASWAWSILGMVFNGIWIGIQAVGSFFVWLWQAAIVPAWNGIVAAASWAWSILGIVFDAIGFGIRILMAVVWTVLVSPWIIAWNLVTAAASWAWNTVLAPVFRAIGDIIGWLYNNVVSPIFGLISAAWGWMAGAIAAGWNNILRPTWDAVAAMAQWLWNNALRPVFDLIAAGWNGLLTLIRGLYDNVLRPTWEAVAALAGWLWNNALRPTFEFIAAGWNGLLTFIRTLYDSVLVPCWNALQAAAQFMWNNVLRPVFEAIGAAWGFMGDAIRNVFNGVIIPTFEALKGAVHAVGAAFDAAVRWIGNVWNTIKGILAHPVNFMIDVVYNRGVKAAWDKIAGWLKIPGLPGVAPIPTNKRGGTMPGYTPGRDTMLSWVSGGESIMRPEWTRAMGPGFVDSANQVARTRGPAGVRKWMGGVNDGPIRPQRQKAAYKQHDGMLLPAFAGGGHTWRRLWDIVKRQFPDISLTSSFRPGDPGYHGRGQAVDVGYGNHSRHGGVAGWLAQTFPASTELISAQLPGGVGIKNGKPLHYGAKTTGEHADHVHWAMAGEPVPGGGGGGLFDIVGMMVDWFINTLMKPVKDAAGQFLPKFGDQGMAVAMSKVPGAAIDAGVNWLKNLGDRLWELMGHAFGGMFGPGGGGGVERWRGVALQALKMTGQPLGLVDILLRRMNQESGGDPNVTNMWDSNAKKGTPSIGLMQTIGPTFEAYKFPGFNNIRAPLDNILASIRYTLATYGSLPAGYNRAGGYDSGGWLPPGHNLTYNGTGKPEAVLTSEQWDSMREAASSGTGTSITVNYSESDVDPERVAASIDRRLTTLGRL